MIIADAFTWGFAVIGAAFCAIAAIGMVRMPDLYTRMQSATKAGSLGVACVALAAGIHFASTVAVIEATLVIIFLLATAPIASILIARAAYGMGLPLWEQTKRDDLKGVIDTRAADADEDA